MFYFFIFTIGLCVGSFLNALIWRVYNDESIIWRKRSYCPLCNKELKNIDLIPVLSFLFLGRKCRWCKGKISWQYPIVEFVVGILFVVATFFVMKNFNLYLLSSQITLLSYYYFIAVLVFIFVFDLKYYIIPDIVSLPSIAIIFIANIFLNRDAKDLILGALIAGVFFWLQYIIPPLGRKLFHNKVNAFKQDWIGGGDIKLGVLMGVMLGWKMTLVALMISYLLGSVVGIILIILKKKELSSKMPFGTFLSVASIIALFWGEEILRWYLRIVLR